MKRILLLILLLIPITIKAETITYELCQSGCEYSSLNTVYQEIRALDKTKTYEITIDVKDGETYAIESNTASINYTTGEAQNSSILVKGPSNNHPTFTVNGNDQSISVITLKTVTIENIDFEAQSGVSLSAINANRSDGHLLVKNSVMKGYYVWMHGYNITLDNVNIEAGYFVFQPSEETTSSYIKNSKIKSTGSTNNEGEDVLFRFPTILQNTEVEGERITSFKLTMTDSTLKGNLNTEEEQKYTNSKIIGSVNFKLYHFELDNVEITGGLKIRDTYCETTSSHPIEKENYIKNCKIRGNGNNPLTIRTRDQFILNINNTDLDDTTEGTCSIVAIAPENDVCMGANPFGKKVMPTYLVNRVNYDDYYEQYGIDIRVVESKVNCAATYSEIPNKKALNMFFDHTNKWSKPISRTTEVNVDNLPSNGNVIERNDGYIIIETSAEDTLVLNVDKEKDMAAYFKDILPEGTVLSAYLIEDESIIKVENGKIIPLKVGTTAVYSVVDNNIYSVFLTVTEADLTNPDTGANLTNVIILIAVLSLIALVLYRKPKKI